MKKLYLMIFFILFSMLCYSQNKNTTYINWKVENENKMGSFFWKVERSLNVDEQGEYKYYIYFYSNSYFNKKSNGKEYDKAISYISNVDIIIKESNTQNEIIKQNKKELQYVVCDHEEKLIEIFSSKYTCNDFILDFEEVTPYSNSMIKK